MWKHWSQLLSIPYRNMENPPSKVFSKIINIENKHVATFPTFSFQIYININTSIRNYLSDILAQFVTFKMFHSEFTISFTQDCTIYLFQTDFIDKMWNNGKFLIKTGVFDGSN